MKRPTTLMTKTAFVLMLTALVSCNEPQKSNEPDKNDKPTVEAPAQIVAIAQAKNMYDSYSKRRVPLIQHYEDSINKNNKDDKGFDVGRYVYYDYKTIKQYLEYIEQEAAEADVEISTLRLYYSNYPDEVVFPNSKDSIKHPRQNSIMLSPTYNDGKRDYLFYIGQGAKGKQAVPLNNDFENIKGYSTHSTVNNKAYASFAPISNTTAEPISIQGQQSLTLNRGSGVPPPKN
ncbi:hypothetical protein LCGC14_0190540 [marine sediment metagenome]|uniref:Lipoprotein n=1 Tax=marine sediment metagenome TaxID=412755 RepID=A0A0F9UM12_9ZZZZ|nr:hypothetical protein [Maribacter sp.]HDZ06630.1 hypothetical protein [Maribacter sp.]HEA81733.1 hypothetical protein [Maribacter sp.]